MMGRHRHETKLYYQLSVDQLIPPQHLLRQIADHIDFSFVYQLTRPYYSDTGQPSIDLSSSSRCSSSATSTASRQSVG